MRDPVSFVVPVVLVVLIATAATATTDAVGGIGEASASPAPEATVPPASVVSDVAPASPTPDVPALAPGWSARTWSDPLRHKGGSSHHDGRAAQGNAAQGGTAQVEPGEGPTGASPSDDPTGTNFTIRLRSNGDAEWTVSMGVNLSGANETRVFRSLGNRYEAGRADIGPGVAPFERANAAAGERINRDMSLLEVSRSARIENGTGYLTLRFVWTNFAEESGSRIRVGDAFLTPRGTWLPGLAADQTLTFVPPPGYGVNSAPIGPDNGTLRWDGPEEFEPGSLTITYRRGLRATATTTTTTTATTTATPPADSGVPLVPLAGIGMLGVGLLVALYARSRGLSLPGDDGARTDAGDGSDAAGEPAEGTASESDSASDGSAHTTGAAGTGVGIDEELLSDEERVERLLEANGGRMRQAAIVTETRWSNAKVSQLLSAMDREGKVDKLRIGRENLISLPDQDVSDAEDD